MSENSLHNILVERVQAAGRITFAEYMAACLYEPGLGYYTSPGRKVGLEGDFYTSITVHGSYGRVLAREIAACWQSMGCPDEFTLVEVGAGHGRLACDIMDFLAEHRSDCYAATKMVLVEKEPSLAEVQARLLSNHTERLSWLQPDKLADFSFKGVLYSNELLDAMPVHRVIMSGDGLKEIYVTHDGEQFQDVADQPSTPALAEYLEKYGLPLHPGQETEVSLAGLAWFDQVAAALQQGFIITVDYGWPKADLYAPERNLGTLLCYYQHTVEDNPYHRQGQQDITSHINFSALMERGEELGLKTVWFGEQASFLLSAGIVEEIQQIEASDLSDKEKLKSRLTIKRLIMPEGGMGNTFRVLVQSKAVDNPQLGCLKGITI